MDQTSEGVVQWCIARATGTSHGHKTQLFWEQGFISLPLPPPSNAIEFLFFFSYLSVFFNPPLCSLSCSLHDNRG